MEFTKSVKRCKISHKDEYQLYNKNAIADPK